MNTNQSKLLSRQSFFKICLVFVPHAQADISCSLVAVGREFTLLIDYSTGKHWELTLSPKTVMMTYSKEFAMQMTACHIVAELLVKEQHAYPREFINANWPDPRVYNIGNIVFAWCAVKSVSCKEQLDKLQYNFTGPWRVMAVLSGASYSLEH
jgi:hypothetical protein